MFTHLAMFWWSVCVNVVFQYGWGCEVNTWQANCFSGSEGQLQGTCCETWSSSMSRLVRINFQSQKRYNNKMLKGSHSRDEFFHRIKFCVSRAFFSGATHRNWTFFFMAVPSPPKHSGHSCLLTHSQLHNKPSLFQGWSQELQYLCAFLYTTSFIYGFADKLLEQYQHIKTGVITHNTFTCHTLMKYISPAREEMLAWDFSWGFPGHKVNRSWSAQLQLQLINTQLNVLWSIEGRKYKQ